MSRLPWRAAHIAAVALVVVIAAPVLAQTPEAESSPEPVITWARKQIRFRGTATIVGRLRNGAAGDVVTLQRRTQGGWREVSAKEVGDDLGVRFRRHRRRYTSAYRLAYTDDAGTTSLSDARRVGVRPRLRLETNPDHPMAGRTIRVKGRMWPRARGRQVTLERRQGGRWVTFARPHAGDGTFAAAFHPASPGRSRIRARFRGDGRNSATRRGIALTVYDPDPATWYGPGFYGETTACGRTLGYHTLGVAHRSLPCGTKVAIVYRGRTVTVPVIDRGPYGSAEWDLTRATAERLDFTGRATVGTAH